MAMSAEDWMVEIENALEYRRVFGREDAWHQIELNYLNDPDGDTAAGPNLIFSMGDSLLSDMSVPNPEFVLTAEHPSGVDRVPIVEAVDNWLVKKMSLKRELDRALLNGYLFGRAIVKLGYDSEFGWSPYYDIGMNNNLMGMTLTQFDNKGNRIENLDTEPGMPWARFVAPQDFVVPWGTVDIDSAPWCAHRVIRLNAHLKKDPKYVKTARLEPQISIESFVESYKGPLKRRVRERYKSGTTYSENVKLIFNEIWEIHDRMTRRVIVVTNDYDKKIRDDVDALQVAGMPFVSSSFVMHPRAFWSTPQAYYLGQIQSELYDITLQRAKQRRINCLKFLAHKSAMSAAEMDKLISGDVGAVGLVDGTSRPLNEVFAPFPRTSNWDLQAEADAATKDARDAVGYSRNQLGEFDASSRRTAREATFVQAGSEKRTMKRAGSVVSLYTDLIRKINKIIFRFWTVPRYAMVGNEWAKFTGAELSGDYLYDVSLSTKRSTSIAERKIESLMLLQQFAQIPGVNLPELLNYVISASSDPGFERILSGARQGTRAAAGALPTIPATQLEGSK